MSAKHRCNRDGSKNWSYPVNSLTPASVGRSRASLLAGASLVALGALAAPDRALAACSGHEPDHFDVKDGTRSQQRRRHHGHRQREHPGGPGGDGVDAMNCAITTLTNQSGGTISGGNGAAGLAGGAGVSNAKHDNDLVQ